MSEKFECIVEINGKKYDIMIDDFGFTAKFSDIYPKVQQIVKIALNEDINFITHEFWTIEYSGQIGVGSVIKNADQLICHKSVIRIVGKPQVSHSPTTSVLLSPQSQADGQQSLNLIFPEEETYLLKNIREIRRYNSIVMAINIGWDLKNNQKTWDNVFQRITGMSPDTRTNQMTNFCQNAFYNWTDHYVKTFYKLNGRMCPQTQEVFNLLKVVHILDLDKLYVKTSSILSKLESISKLPESVEYFQKYLKDLRIEKILTKETEVNVSQTNDSQTDSYGIPVLSKSFHCSSVPPLPQKTKIEFKDMRSERGLKSKTKPKKLSLTMKEEELIKHEKDIECYHSIVMAINIGWNLRDHKKWEKVSKKLPKNMKSIMDGEGCRSAFHKWTLFYIMNYYKLDAMLEPKTQKIFDLLKIVHILDLRQIYGPRHPNQKKVAEISKTPELRHYFKKHLKDIWVKKRKSKAVDSCVNKRFQSPKVSINDSPHRTDSASKGQKEYRFRVIDHRNDRKYDHKKPMAEKTLRREEEQLKDDEKEIEDYHKIVLAINIGWEFPPWDFIISDKNWQKVSQTINQIRFTPKYCNNMFYFWTRLYSKMYDKLNGNLEPSSQKIFDLLKVVHTLNTYKFDFSEETEDRLERIDSYDSFKSYYSKHLFEIRDIKEESKEDKSMDKEKRVSERHLNAYRRLLIKDYTKTIELTPNASNSEPTNATNSIISEANVRSYTPPLVLTPNCNSIESQSINSAPILDPIKNVIQMSTNSPLSYDTIPRNSFNCRLPFSQVFVFKPIEEKECPEEGLSFLGYKKFKENSENICHKTDQQITQQMSQQMTSIPKICDRVMTSDPRLRKKSNSIDSEGSSDGNTQQIDKRQSIVAVSDSNRPSDPRLKRKENTVISETKTIDQQIDGNSSSNNTIPSEPIVFKSFQSTDPRIKRVKKRPTTEETVEQSLNEEINPNKKLKSNEIEIIELD